MLTSSETRAPSLVLTADSPPAIRVEELSIRFHVPRERILSFKEFAIRWIQRRLEYVDFWALRGVDLSVGAAEMWAVVGDNGAGKSTLVKAIAGLLHPTEGRVIVHGEQAALVDLAGGFHPELTGRENVYLYGTLLGMRRREIDAHFEEIVEFSGLWDFIHAPLRTYSTGMVARLGFAVATARQVQVLLVDEALAVGDLPFQARCLQRMAHFREQGTTILFVTHALDIARDLCDRALWLDAGQVREHGPASQVIDAYRAEALLR